MAKPSAALAPLLADFIIALRNYHSTEEADYQSFYDELNGEAPRPEIEVYDMRGNLVTDEFRRNNILACRATVRPDLDRDLLGDPEQVYSQDDLNSTAFG